MLALVVSSLALAASAQNLAEVACGRADLSTLCAAAGASPDALAALTGEGDLTLLAPNNAAFESLEEFLGFDVVSFLLSDNPANADALFSTLAYHLIGGVVRSTDLADGPVPTVNGAELTVEDMPASFTDELGRVASVVEADISASNGIVHIIDEVVVTQAIAEALPALNIVEVVVETETLSTLEAAVVATGLDEILSTEGPFTVFAPTDDAFAALGDALGFDYLTLLLNEFNLPTLEAIVLGHAAIGARVYASQLVDGQEITTAIETTLTIDLDEGVTVSTDAFTANVIGADVDATNGVAHVVDTVLVTADQAALLPTLDIVDTAIDAGLSTLVTAVEAAGLVDLLKSEGPFTVFAPTNEAFEAVEGLDELLEDPEALGAILAYHVYTAEGPGGRVYSTQLEDGQEIPTLLEGASVDVSITEAGVFINGAQVVIADITTTNGVVHVIDTVLVPASELEVEVEIVSGNCRSSGVIRIDAAVSGAEPGSTVAVLFGPVRSTFELQTEVCNGLSVDIGTSRFNLYTADENGEWEGEALRVPASVCGWWVQAIDTTTCAKSAVAKIE